MGEGAGLVAGDADAAADGEALAAGDGAVLADGEAVGLADASGLGVGEGGPTSVLEVVAGCLLRLRPMGTTTIPSAVTMRKAIAPHSRRRKSRFTLPSPATQLTSVVV